MRRIVVFVTIATIGLMLALSIGGGADALRREVSSGNLTSAFSNNDKDKDKDKDNGGGNGNADDQSNNGNGNASGNGKGNGNGNSGNNGNGNEADNAGNGNENGAGSNGQGNENSNNGGQPTKDEKDKNNGNSGDGDDANASVQDEGSKVRVCHLTERDDFPYNLIEVSENALPAHEGHGDFQAPDGASSSNDCEDGAVAPPVGSPEAPEPESPPDASPVASEKVRVCHVTSSETNPFNLIEVSVNALPAHEDHGDVVAADDADSSNDCEDEMGGTPVASPEVEPIG